MSAGTQSFLNWLLAIKAINCSVLGWNRLLHFAKDPGIVFHPINEQTPGCIADRAPHGAERHGLRQTRITNHVPHLQILIGNEVVRHHQRTGWFHSPVFTLPTHFQVLPSQTICCFLAILGSLLLFGNSPLQPFQFALRLPQKSGVFYLSAIGCLVEILQPQVNANGFACGWNRFLSVNRNAKLSVVAIRFAHNPNPLNLGNRVEMQVPGSYQQKGSGLETIGEGKMLPVFRELPPRGFVFHRAAILLEPGEALLSGLLSFAIVVEPFDSRPGTLRASLSCHRAPHDPEGHRIKLACPFKFLGQYSTELGEVVLS
nr:hypothetical protein [Thermostichus vulcanus]